MKKLFFISLIFLTFNLSAQDLWTKKADFQGTYRIRAVGFSINGKGYMGTGYDPVNGVLMDDWWEYDPTTDTWTKMADFPGGARQNAVGFSIGNKGYLGTGTNGAYFKDFWEYDPILNQWTQKTDFGGAPRQGAVGFSINSKGYVATGNETSTTVNYYNDLWEFNPSINQWVQKANIPALGRKDATVFVIGSTAYVGCGDYTTVFSDYYKYDPTLNVWQPISNFGGGAIFYAAGFSINGMGYAGTGSPNSFTRVDTFLTYDPLTDLWSPKANFAGGNRTLACGFSIGNKGYIGTGYISGMTWAMDFWEYNPDTTTSILEKHNYNSFIIYPNPTNNKSTIEFNNFLQKNHTLKLYDIQGRIVKTIDNITSDIIIIDTDNLIDGLYFFQLNTNKEVRFTGKLIVK